MSVSVVIPVYNEQDNVPLLAAEFAPVAQQVPGLEVLLVDDGSSDDSIASVTIALIGVFAARSCSISGDS